MNRPFFTAIIYGWITIFILMIVLSFLLSLILKYVTMAESTLAYISFIAGLLTLFLAGLIGGMKGKGNGWMIGFITGLGFTTITFSIQYLGFNEGFSLPQLMYHITYILLAIMGSIIGVNLVKNNAS